MLANSTAQTNEFEYAGQFAGFARCIRICSKKKCWRTGGKAIWETLNRHIADSELAHTVRLETVDCLENCKRGPNLECDGSLFQNCTSGKAVEFLKTKTFDPGPE